MQITRKRARLIAKDQTASFNGALNQARQTQIGIDRYIWETMQDERVRHEHAKRHGKTFYWSQPPEDGHPGEPINCRCTAIPLAVQLGR
jgi:SPP1 gp7 family putative phage head morphogenesis protein